MTSFIVLAAHSDLRWEAGWRESLKCGIMEYLLEVARCIPQHKVHAFPAGRKLRLYERGYAKRPNLTNRLCRDIADEVNISSSIGNIELEI